MINLLFCEDHGVVREGVGMLLKAEPGISLIGVAEDGLEAVQKVKELQPDIVLVDLSLPKLHGFEVIRQTAMQTKTRAIAFTMFSEDCYVVEAFLAGASGYIIKSSSLKELMDGIRNVAGGGFCFSTELPKALVERCIKLSKGRTKSDLLGCLSNRERTVFQLVGEGLNSAEISSKLSISVRTVETYRTSVSKKLCFKIRQSGFVLLFGEALLFRRDGFNLRRQSGKNKGESVTGNRSRAPGILLFYRTRSKALRTMGLLEILPFRTT